MREGRNGEWRRGERTTIGYRIGYTLLDVPLSFALPS